MSLRSLFFSERTEGGHEYGGKWRCGERLGGGKGGEIVIGL